MSASEVYWKFCPGCNRSLEPGIPTCPKCGRSAVMTDAEQIAEAMVAAQRRERNRSGGCASIFLAVIVVLVGFGLLFSFPIVGILFFGVLIVAALIRMASR